MMPTTCEGWIQTATIIARVYLATYLLQGAFVAGSKFTAGGGIVAVIEFLLGACIATGKLMPFAAGLIFLYTLASTIPGLHSAFFYFYLPPDHWEMAVVLIACGILMCAVWIMDIVERLSAPYALKEFSEEPISTNLDRWHQDVEITVRLDACNPGTPQRRRCIVTIHDARRLDRNTKHKIGNALDGD